MLGSECIVRLAIHPLNQGFDGPRHHTILGLSVVSGVACKGVPGKSDPLLPRGESKPSDCCINPPRVSVPDRICVTPEGSEDCDPGDRLRKRRCQRNCGKGRSNGNESEISASGELDLVGSRFWAEVGPSR